MATAEETYVRVAADSTGKHIRNLMLEVLDSTGVRNDVYMQVVNLGDLDGNIIGTVAVPLVVESPLLSGLIEDLINEVRKLRTVVELRGGMTLD